MQPSTSSTTPGRSSALRRYGPLALVILLVAGVVVAVVAGGGDDEAATPTTTSQPAGSTSTDPADAVLLAPALSYQKAQKEGRDASVDWGDRCDTSIGRLKLPLFPQPQCFAPFSGDNGGATTTGVTAGEVKVVVYLPQKDDPVLNFVYKQIQNDDTPDQTFETYERFNEMFGHYYETYGRKVVLERFDATGTIADSQAAQADALAIAARKPFLVIGGPLLTNVFAETLAAQKVICLACTPGQPNDWYERQGPYVWDVQKNPEQNQQLIAEYVGKRLAGRPAAFAGDDAMKGRQRVFGYIHIAASVNDQQLEDRFTGRLKSDYGVEFADIATYQLPTELTASGRDMITALKEKGVTTVVFSGDPLAPQTLTQIATTQNYFPEWVITGTVLVDTAAFSRTYDQGQWAHAFGPSNLAARIDPAKFGALYLYNWYYGTDPPADQTAPLITPGLQFVYNALQPMGTTVTPDNLRTVLFGAAIFPSTPATPQISYGVNRGPWVDPDYSALDDQTEVWWDPEATGPDELGRDGIGMWRYVDGGVRYLRGQWPTSEPRVFDPEGSVTLLPEVPEGVRLRTDYVPLR